MLGMGFGEIILIAGIALVVIGPEKFPDFAKILLRTFRDVRQQFDEMKTDISKELQPMKRELNELTKQDPEKYIDALMADEEDQAENGGSTDYDSDDQDDHEYGEHGYAYDYDEDTAGSDSDDSEEMLSEGLGADIGGGEDADSPGGNDLEEMTSEGAVGGETGEDEGTESLDGNGPQEMTSEGGGDEEAADADDDFEDIDLDAIPERLDG